MPRKRKTKTTTPDPEPGRTDCCTVTSLKDDPKAAVEKKKESMNTYRQSVIDVRS